MTSFAPGSSSPSSLRRRAPILVILALALVAVVFFRDWLSLHQLETHRQALLALRDRHYLAVSLGFIALYVAVVVISVPGAILLTLTGGFLFGLFPGVVYNVIAATLGAVIVFIAARSGFGHDMAEGIARRGGPMARLAEGLRANEVSVLLTMRLIPVVPFFIANIAAALVGVRLRTFAITTFVGIIPADVIYTQLGAGLNGVFERGEHPDLHVLLRPEFLWPLLGLAALAALPLLLKLRPKR
jgi:uncharacterized membrane protein YdjX (TVP38/TMEM64 family)